VRHDAAWLPEVLEGFMALDRYDFERHHKGSVRTDDLRAGVLAASATASVLQIRCALVPKAVRPTDVVTVLARIAGRPAPHVVVERVELLAAGDNGPVGIDEQGLREPVAR
jgi:hypothetical protein